MEIRFEKLEEEIITYLSGASDSVDIAVSWFTNNRIYNTLLEKVKEGINIRLITLSDKINNNKDGLDFQKLINAGVKLYLCAGPHLMHHKFCIIDSKILLNGSCNWTNRIDDNDENLIVIKEQAFVLEFKNRFKYLCSKNKFVVKYYKEEKSNEIERNFIPLESNQSDINIDECELIIVSAKNETKGFVTLDYTYPSPFGAGLRGLEKMFVSMSSSEINKLSLHNS
ncbi:MAG: hypothetical protein HN704_08570 [Bacteroidetes bacterium]|jgi:phosphatidylserine/phosphatidylglycerophosphate/cardiolipin synthase-like enzyme|nr:hypothetical protein [Bacteroidota bacterium]MBT6834905.1 hypothetical protein [Bacteroidota bacterium]MBT7038285.1 hypothetical protein [Bacteroidota bacterium]MBT7491645.1 hypothetical protein [Bacteroidota bacterium]